MNAPDAYSLGVKIITNPMLIEPCADFSRARSPSRAMRRWKQKGIRGRGVFERPSRSILQLPDGLFVCHPAMYASLCQIVERHAS
jgi:hypothetical protein